MTYEIMKQFVIAGAFGMMIGLFCGTIGYWIVAIVKWICWKVKKHQSTEKSKQ